MVLLAAGLAPWPASADSDQTQRRVQFNRGIVAFGQGDYAAAQRIFEDLVGEDGADVAALYWLGLCQLQRDDYAAAGATFQKVIEIAPEHLEAKLDAAVAFAGQERYEQSRDFLQDFIEAGVADADTNRLAHFFLGVAEYKTENYEEALAALQVAEQDTTSTTMLANVAWYRGWPYETKDRVGLG